MNVTGIEPADVIETIMLSNDTEACKFESLSHIPYMQPSLEQLQNISRSAGMYHHERLIELALFTKRGVCKEPSSEFMKFFCHWKPTLESGFNYLYNATKIQSTVVDLPFTVNFNESGYRKSTEVNLTHELRNIFSKTLRSWESFNQQYYNTTFPEFGVNFVTRAAHNVKKFYTRDVVTFSDPSCYDGLFRKLNYVGLVGRRFMNHTIRFMGNFSEKYSKLRLSEIHQHYYDLTTHKQILHENSTFVEHVNAKLILFTQNDYKLASRHKDLKKYWTGLGDKTLLIYWTSVPDIAQSIGCILCWFPLTLFGVNCCNNTGCMPMFVSDQSCFTDILAAYHGRV
jgi:hypothetical protein